MLTMGPRDLIGPLELVAEIKIRFGAAARVKLSEDGDRRKQVDRRSVRCDAYLRVGGFLLCAEVGFVALEGGARFVDQIVRQNRGQLQDCVGILKKIILAGSRQASTRGDQTIEALRLVLVGVKIPGCEGLLGAEQVIGIYPVSYTHLRAHETGRNLVC